MKTDKQIDELLYCLTKLWKQNRSLSFGQLIKKVIGDITIEGLSDRQLLRIIEELNEKGNNG